MTDQQAVTGAIFSLGSEGASRFFRSAVGASNSPASYVIFVRQYVSAVVPFLNRPEELRAAHQSLLLKLPGEMAHLASAAPRGEELGALSQLYPVMSAIFKYPEREDVSPDQITTMYQTWQSMIASTSRQRAMLANFAATSLGELRNGRHTSENAFTVLNTLRQAASHFPEMEADIMADVAIAPKSFVSDKDNPDLTAQVTDLLNAGTDAGKALIRDRVRAAADRAVKIQDFDEAVRLGQLMFAYDDSLSESGKLLFRRNDDTLAGIMVGGMQHLERFADVAAFKIDENVMVAMDGKFMSYDEAWDYAGSAVGVNGRSLTTRIHDVLMQLQADIDNPFAMEYTAPERNDRPVLRGAWGQQKTTFLPANPYDAPIVTSPPPKTAAVDIGDADPNAKVVSLAAFRRPKPGAEPTV
jgi:hypothetical protein